MSAQPHKDAIRRLEWLAGRKGQRIGGKELATIAYAVSVIAQLADAEARHLGNYRDVLREKIDAEAKRDALVRAVRDGLEVAS